MTPTVRCNLRKIMYDREIRTFAEVIRRTGVNRNTIKKLYQSKDIHRVQMRTLSKVCAGLGCSLQELIHFP